MAKITYLHYKMSSEWIFPKVEYHRKSFQFMKLHLARLFVLSLLETHKFLLTPWFIFQIARNLHVSLPPPKNKSTKHLDLEEQHRYIAITSEN